MTWDGGKSQARAWWAGNDRLQYAQEIQYITSNDRVGFPHQRGRFYHWHAGLVTQQPDALQVGVRYINDIKANPVL